MKIDDTSAMTSRFTVSRTRGGVQPPADEFAEVFELAAARQTRPLPGGAAESIPPEVWAEVDRAHRLADELAARGQEVRFETHRLSGRVVASLCDRDGGVVRPLTLTDLVPDPGARLDEAVL